MGSVGSSRNQAGTMGGAGEGGCSGWMQGLEEEGGARRKSGSRPISQLAGAGCGQSRSRLPPGYYLGLPSRPLTPSLNIMLLMSQLRILSFENRTIFSWLQYPILNHSNHYFTNRLVLIFPPDSWCVAGYFEFSHLLLALIQLTQ